MMQCLGFGGSFWMRIGDYFKARDDEMEVMERRDKRLPGTALGYWSCQAAGNGRQMLNFSLQELISSSDTYFPPTLTLGELPVIISYMRLRKHKSKD